MDIRVLEYFLMVAREESITKAAQALHITQPTLSRQMLDLEAELGKNLFVRGKRKLQLTEEGWFLRKRAIEIVELATKTKTEISYADKSIGGDIYFGGGEAEGMRYVAKTAKALQTDYPLIRVHLYSGNGADVMERLDRGLLDFGLVIGLRDESKYDIIRLPSNTVYGLLMRRDSPLAAKETVSPEDVIGLPLLITYNRTVRSVFSEWAGRSGEMLNIVGTFNMIYNAAFMVEEGLGYALTLEGLTKDDSGSALCFRPLGPRLEVSQLIVRRRHQAFSRAVELFYERLRGYENASLLSGRP